MHTHVLRTATTASTSLSLFYRSSKVLLVIGSIRLTFDKA